VQLGKLEALYAALAAANASRNPRVRRTLAGALVTMAERRLLIERAPMRKGRRRSA
jgi:tRNA(Ile)-lysidine synthase